MTLEAIHTHETSHTLHEKIPAHLADEYDEARGALALLSEQESACDIAYRQALDALLSVRAQRDEAIQQLIGVKEQIRQYGISGADRHAIAQELQQRAAFYDQLLGYDQAS
jgi:hypothetical protein